MLTWDNSLMAKSITRKPEVSLLNVKMKKKGLKLVSTNIFVYFGTLSLPSTMVKKEYRNL